MLNIITACVRPKNLKLLHESILRAKDFFKGEIDICWHICFDITVTSHFPDLENFIQNRELDFTPNIQSNLFDVTSGMTPITTALKRIEKGLVCNLDDDNLMHHAFIKKIYPLYEEGWRGFLYHQLLGIDKNKNNKIRTVKPVKIKPGAIDSAQFCFDKSLIGAVEWRKGVREPDGIFISEIFSKNYKFIKIIEDVLCYYNALRKPSIFSDLPPQITDPD